MKKSKKIEVKSLPSMLSDLKTGQKFYFLGSGTAQKYRKTVKNGFVYSNPDGQIFRSAINQVISFHPFK